MRPLLFQQLVGVYVYLIRVVRYTAPIAGGMATTAWFYTQEKTVMILGDVNRYLSGRCRTAEG